jgi:hypothetical protein
LRGLREYGPRCACFLERAKQLLDHENWRVRAAAIVCLLSLRGEAESAVPRLTQILMEDPENRRSAANALGSF